MLIERDQSTPHNLFFVVWRYEGEEKLTSSFVQKIDALI